MPLLFSFLLPFLFILDTDIEWTTPKQHNFGKILRDSQAIHIFIFKNLSDNPIVIDNVRTDCSCTASDWATTPILPKETGKVTVTLDTHKTGYFRKKITVWIHGQRQADKLVIEGEVTLSEK